VYIIIFKNILRRLYSYITETLAYNEYMNIFTATAAKKNRNAVRRDGIYLFRSIAVFN